MGKVPMPVIRCDMCRRVVAARTGAYRGVPAVAGKEREAELRTLGWLITPKMDLCPDCNRLPSNAE